MAWDHDSVYGALKRKFREGKLKPVESYIDPFVVLYEQEHNCALIYRSDCHTSAYRLRPLRMNPTHRGWRQEILDRLLAASGPAIDMRQEGTGQHTGWIYFRVIDWGALADAIGLNELPTMAELESQFQQEVERELTNPSNDGGPDVPDSFSAVPRTADVIVRTFIRNPKVWARALRRACGRCEDCGQPAPFIRRSDGTPFLEVHHKVPLADGGLDIDENAIAVCPNCHRRAHYG